MNRHAVVLIPALAAALLPAGGAGAQGGKGRPTVWVTTRAGENLEGTLAGRSLRFQVDGKSREVPLNQLLSVQTAAPASSTEAERINADLAAVAGPDRPARDRAVAELTDLGLAALTPLLNFYKDTDLREPNPLYRLFERLVPGYADTLDRSLDLVRLADGDTVRGKLEQAELKLTLTDGKQVTVPGTEVRRLAVRQKEIRRTINVHSLRHSTQIEWLDTGTALSPASRVEETAKGFVRLSFNIDGWASDADGIQKPGPNYKTNLVDGFPFGALLGRVGVTGERWLAGKHAEKTGLPSGRLYLAVNDNPHWQNNVGSFRVNLRVTDAYDLGDAQ